MRILKIIHGYPPDYNAGSEVYSQSICNELSNEHHVSVFTREQKPLLPDYRIRHQNISANLDLYFINNPQGKDRFRRQQIDDKFGELLTEIKPDVAHIGHLNHLSTGLVDELNKQNIPIVFTLHDFWLMCPRGQFVQRNSNGKEALSLCDCQEDRKCATTCYSQYFTGIEYKRKAEVVHWTNWVATRMKETRSIVEKVDLFIAPSRYLQKRFVDEFQLPEKKIIHLDYGFPTKRLNKPERPKRKQPYTFGYIGTHIPSKGVHQLIQAFRQIDAPSMLRIYGRANGSTNALKELADGTMNKIKFVGEYDNENIVTDVFAKVDCIVVPSLWAENSPLVIHEAQACKIPVITADFGGMKEYIQHRKNGLLFQHRNTNALCEQMTYALNNPKLMKGYGQEGYLYSEDGTVPDIVDHCKELLTIYRQTINTRNLWRITIDTNPEDCNLHCIMCEEHSPHSNFKEQLYENTGVKRRRMPVEWIDQIFKQAKELGVREIIPSTMGEPLLYKGIDRIFELSASSGIKINLTTNGTFPKKPVEEWAKMIVPNTVDVKISWNGATRETAEKVMLGVNFDSVLEKVKAFISYRDKHFQETGHYCRITFQLTFMQNNMHELAGIIRLAASLGVDRVKGHHLWTHFKEIEEFSMKASTASIGDWNKYVQAALDAQEDSRKPDGTKVLLENIIPIQNNHADAVPEEYVCPFLTKELWISATGNYSPCCAPDELRQTLGDFGNIKTQSLGHVMKSDSYTELTRNYKKNALCQSCNMRKPV